MFYGLFGTIFFMSSLPLLCLGIMGEYLGRVYDEVSARPLSIINRVYQSEQVSLHALRSEQVNRFRARKIETMFPAA